MKLRLFDVVWILFLAFHLLPIVPEYISIGVRMVLWWIVLAIFISKTRFNDIAKILSLYSVSIAYILYALYCVYTMWHYIAYTICALHCPQIFQKNSRHILPRVFLSHIIMYAYSSKE